MKGRLIVLGEHGGREAAALIVDGRLEDLLVAGDDPLAPGAILRGVADRLVKGQGGVFVRLPGGKTGYLRDTSGVAPGRPLLVQIAGTAEPGKAVPLTTRLLFKGRHVIVTPGAPGVNVSRRIRETERRDHLERLGRQGLGLRDGAQDDPGEAETESAGPVPGLILRSAAEFAETDDILGEISELLGLCRQIEADVAGAPELLLDAPGPHETAWRDWTDPSPDQVDDGVSAWEDHGLPAMIAALLRPEVALGNGASMFVEPTRALVAVDVNTGSDTSPAAGLKANIAAARDLPRQLRLRGLGGQVVVDVAPMPKRDRAAFEQQLRAALRGESAETTLAGWTPLGHLEIQRKRDRLPLEWLVKGVA